MTTMRRIHSTTQVLSLLLLCATALSAQDNKYGEFYLKDQVKGFISLHGELRGLTDNAVGDINSAGFRGPWYYPTINQDGDTVLVSDAGRVHQYNQFGNRVLGLGFEIGARYHRLLTWFDIFFSPTQESEVPEGLESGQPYLHSVKWYQYGFDWMWGYMLAPEESQINLIPSVGFGFSVLNMQFPSTYYLPYGDAPPDEEMETYSMGRRYYSTFGKDVTGQIEIRLNLGAGLSLGGFGGMRMTWYDRFYVESEEREYFLTYDELVGHAWFLGGKITYTMSSRSEDKERDRL